MNRSIEVLKAIYKPYRYTIKGNSMIIDTKTGPYLIKKKNKDIKELFNYLSNRGFNSYPKLIDASRKDVFVYEYLSEYEIPKEQKLEDLITTLADLHKKTSFNKEVSEDTYKAIYEDIKSNIEYLKNYYNTLYDVGFEENFMAPSTYELMRNFTSIMLSLAYCDEKLDEWYQLVLKKTKMRVCIVHNKPNLNHFIEGEKTALVSWDDYLIDTPVIDLVHIYKNEYNNADFESLFDEYFSLFPMYDYEKKLLYILLMLPSVIDKSFEEFERCLSTRKVISYVLKTQKLVGIHNPKEQDEESDNLKE